MRIWLAPFRALSITALVAVGAVSLFSPLTQSFADSHAAGLGDALANSSRPDADKARDAGRKPAEVLHFVGIGKGMTVIDLMASGGYYTEVLSIAVGETGTVYAQNPAAFLQWNDGMYEKALSERLANGRLANVKRIDTGLPESGLAAASLDAAMTAINFHDLYNSNPQAGVQALTELLPLLKPGGVVGLIDHHGNADGENAKLHRIHVDLVVAAAREAGFDVDGQSDILANPDDDHTKGVFDPSIRGKTDRFVLRLKRPE